MSRLTLAVKLPKQFTFVLVASIVLCPAGSANAAVAPVVYLPKAEDAKTGNRLQLPGPWGKTVKGLRCRITELALAEQRFTVEIQNQSDKPIRVITAPKSGWPDSIGLEWAFYDPGKPPKWERILWAVQTEPVEPGHVVLEPGKSHYRTSVVSRMPGSRFKVRCATSLGINYDLVEFIETGAVELPTSVSVTGISGNTGRTGEQAVGEELSAESSTESSRPIREDEDILKYAEWLTQHIHGAAFDEPRLEKAARELKDIPRPWTVTAILKHYRAEVKKPKLNDSRIAHLIFVLAASRDPRAAVVLWDLPGMPRITRYTRLNLNHTLRAVYEGVDYFLPALTAGGAESKLRAIEEWWKENENPIRAAAAELEKRAEPEPIEGAEIRLRPIREDEDILDYVTTQRISLRSVMPIIAVEGSPEEVLQRSEESFRKFIAELPKPRTVSKLLKLYGEENDAARKLDLKRVLALSGDSRAGAATGPSNDILVFPYPGNRRGQAELERFSASLRKTRIERPDDLLRQMLEQAPPDAVRNYLKDLREKDRAASRNASSLLARLAEIGRLDETTAPGFLQKASAGRDVDAICISLFVRRTESLEALAVDTLRHLADPRAVKSLAIRLQWAMCAVDGGAEPQMMREQLRWSLVRALSSCTGIEIPKRLRTGELGDSRGVYDREVSDGIAEFLQKCKVWLVGNGPKQPLPQKSDNGDSPPADKPDATPPRNLDLPQTQPSADTLVAGVAPGKLPALPAPWGKTVKGLRCRITELALAKERFTVEMQNQSDEPIRVITAPKGQWPDSIGLEWAFYDPGQSFQWKRMITVQLSPPGWDHVVLQPGKSHYRTSGFLRMPGSRFKVRYTTWQFPKGDPALVETGAVELPVN